MDLFAHHPGITTTFSAPCFMLRTHYTGSKVVRSLYRSYFTTCCPVIVRFSLHDPSPGANKNTRECVTHGKLRITRARLEFLVTFTSGGRQKEIAAVFNILQNTLKGKRQEVVWAAGLCFVCMTQQNQALLIVCAMIWKFKGGEYGWRMLLCCCATVPSPGFVVDEACHITAHTRGFGSLWRRRC